MSLKEHCDFDLLVNIMKDIVISELEKQLDLPEYKRVCRCQECVLDITAIALNQLKPMYGSLNSFKGVMYKDHIGQKSETDVIDAIRKSIEKVANNPPH